MDPTKKSRLKKSHSPGLTLVEAIISIVILLVAGMALVSFLRSVSISSIAIEDRARAHQIVNQIHQHLLKKDFKSLESRYTSFPQIIRNSRFKAEATIEEPERNKKTRQTTIHVEWVTNGEPKMLTRELYLISYALPN